MIKTKIFTEDFDKSSIDKQINKWLDQHSDCIVVDVKLQSHLLKNDEYSSYIVRDALVIYREYENV
ncbi:hypothetical protein LX03_02920 [Limosilactobacillus mucosae]|uniref:Sporulation protein Cse60 n=1 Tax=Limosilactobacillus mucosae TaxID=97478 RepID=A0A099YAB5_LIMMU|nr:hypothetical protein LX03_02920 [Limosilactobacillus mucosae]